MLNISSAVQQRYQNNVSNLKEVAVTVTFKNKFLISWIGRHVSSDAVYEALQGLSDPLEQASLQAESFRKTSSYMHAYCTVKFFLFIEFLGLIQIELWIQIDIKGLAPSMFNSC